MNATFISFRKNNIHVSVFFLTYQACLAVILIYNKTDVSVFICGRAVLASLIRSNAVSRKWNDRSGDLNG